MKSASALRRIIVVGLWLAAIGPCNAFTTVIIDAGHGGGDGGTVWNGLVEKRICLDVAKRLETALKLAGLKTSMTRREDVTTSLSARAELANRYSRAIFVSIHFNASRKTEVSGLETHYRSAKAKVLATSVQAALDRSIPGKNRGIQWHDYKVLRETKCPAILVECGFISNKIEARNCGSSAHRQKLAVAIAQGILAQRKKL
jgi:N-acetylmuramoyl-L-alanine amidase